MGHTRTWQTSEHARCEISICMWKNPPNPTPMTVFVRVVFDISWLIDWLINWLIYSSIHSDSFIDYFTVFLRQLRTFSHIWRRPHCRWRAAGLKPMLDVLVSEQVGLLSRHTWCDMGLNFFLVSSDPPSHLVASYNKQGDAEDIITQALKDTVINGSSFVHSKPLKDLTFFSMSETVCSYPSCQHIFSEKLHSSAA
jgi:hypothetical protein